MGLEGFGTMQENVFLHYKLWLLIIEFSDFFQVILHGSITGVQIIQLCLEFVQKIVHGNYLLIITQKIFLLIEVHLGH